MADLLYVEVLVGTTTLKKCSTCGKLIRWPEEARIYAPDTKVMPIYYDHVEHPVRPDSAPAQLP